MGVVNFTTDDFHDTYILSVSEDKQDESLIMEVDFPADWFESKYEKRTLRFNRARNYQVREIPFEGSPQILEVKASATAGGLTHYTLETNAGTREITCESVEFVS
jgi:hypothetical protein